MKQLAVWKLETDGSRTLAAIIEPHVGYIKSDDDLIHAAKDFIDDRLGFIITEVNFQNIKLAE